MDWQIVGSLSFSMTAFHVGNSFEMKESFLFANPSRIPANRKLSFISNELELGPKMGWKESEIIVRYLSIIKLTSRCIMGGGDGG